MHNPLASAAGSRQTTSAARNVDDAAFINYNTPWHDDAAEAGPHRLRSNLTVKASPRTRRASSRAATIPSRRTTASIGISAQLLRRLAGRHRIRRLLPELSQPSADRFIERCRRQPSRFFINGDNTARSSGGIGGVSAPAGCGCSPARLSASTDGTLAVDRRGLTASQPARLAADSWPRHTGGIGGIWPTTQCMIRATSPTARRGRAAVGCDCRHDRGTPDGSDARLYNHMSATPLQLNCALAYYPVGFVNPGTGTHD